MRLVKARRNVTTQEAILGVDVAETARYLLCGWGRRIVVALAVAALWFVWVYAAGGFRHHVQAWQDRTACEFFQTYDTLHATPPRYCP